MIAVKGSLVEQMQLGGREVVTYAYTIQTTIHMNSFERGDANYKELFAILGAVNKEPLEATDADGGNPHTLPKGYVRVAAITEGEEGAIIRLRHRTSPWHMMYDRVAKEWKQIEEKSLFRSLDIAGKLDEFQKKHPQPAAK